MSNQAKSNNSPADVIFWVDCEMTGLGDSDELIEIAVVPTDLNLNFLDNENPENGIKYVIKPSENGLNLLKQNDFVLKMHKSSGLFDELENGESLEDVQEKVYSYLLKFEPRVQTGLLGGNSVHADKKFIDKYMPKVSKHLHYRLIDVSTIKELSKAWYPEVFVNAKEKDSKHRAFDDIIESIEELREYRKNVFRA